MPNNFDEASAATEKMFDNNEQLSLADVSFDEGTSNTAEGETDVQDTSDASAADEQAVLDDAVQTAETAAQVASDKDNQLQQAVQEREALKQQNEQLQGQNQQLQGMVDELSEQNKKNIVEEALSPPILDVNALAFADEETIKAAQEKYANEMLEYNRRQIMKELSPAIEYAKRGIRESEKAETINTLVQIPELSGLKEMLPQLDRIIENNKWLKSDDMPMDEKYINAFAIAKGINSINTPPEPEKELTVEELMELYNNSPAFQELVEKQRLEQIKQSQQVPPFSASSGAVNAALNIKEKPKTFEEASQRTRQMFGIE